MLRRALVVVFGVCVTTLLSFRLRFWFCQLLFVFVTVGPRGVTDRGASWSGSGV